MNFSGSSRESVKNAGTITIHSGGLGALIAPEVSNTGVIRARLGRVALASAQGVAVDLHGDGLVKFLPGDGAQQALVENAGRIEVDGGTVYLSAQAAQDVVSASVNVFGVVQARSVSASNGVIRLSGSNRVSVTDGGLLEASGGTHGGRIDVTGREVLLESASLKATGSEQGGLIRVRGEFQGGKSLAGENSQFVERWGETPELASASETTIGKAATLDVSASSVDGVAGTAVVWSENTTIFSGQLDVRGGAGGGAIELSSLSNLYASLANVRINDGELLLDPKNITVGSGGDYVSWQQSSYSGTAFGYSDIGVGAIELKTVLDNGTDVILKASNDIAVGAAISATGGGNLTLSAGRSVLLNANIGIGSGDVTVIANDLLSNGVVDSWRDAGAAKITMASGQSLSTSGAVNFELRAGTGKTHTESGNITLGNITAASIRAINAGPTADSGIVIPSGSTLSASGTSDAIVLAGDRFTNNAGSSAFSTESGRYLVWSEDPTDGTRGGLTHQFKQYSATFDTTTVAQSTGSGFLYEVAPSLTVSVQNNPSKTYDGDTTVTLGASYFGVTGLLDEDSAAVTFSSAAYDSKNAGNRAVTASGVSLSVAAADSGVAVYGYQLPSITTATGSATITPKGLTVSGITASDKIYDGTASAIVDVSGVVYTGLVSGDALAASVTGAFSDKNVGAAKTVTLTSVYSGADVS